MQAGQMSFDSLAPKLDLDSLLKSLKVFYSELTSIDSLDLTHVTSQDIVYGGKVEIFNPEHIKIVKCDKRKNIGHKLLYYECSVGIHLSFQYIEYTAALPHTCAQLSAAPGHNSKFRLLF